MKFLPILAEFLVTDYNKSINFYVNIIGFKVEYTRENPNFAFLFYNGSQIMIQELRSNEKEEEKLEGDIKSTRERLKDKNFTSKAPADVVKRFKERLEESELQVKKIKSNLKTLK